MLILKVSGKTNEGWCIKSSATLKEVWENNPWHHLSLRFETKSLHCAPGGWNLKDVGIYEAGGVKSKGCLRIWHFLTSYKAVTKTWSILVIFWKSNLNSLHSNSSQDFQERHDHIHMLLLGNSPIQPQCDLWELLLKQLGVSFSTRVHLSGCNERGVNNDHFHWTIPVFAIKSLSY